MKLNALAHPFARRMLPLALLTTILVGLVLPSLYQYLVLTERSSEATLWAGYFADGVVDLAQKRPRLWAHDRLALEQIASSITERPVGAHVRLDLPNQDAVFESGPDVESGQVLGWAVVHLGSRSVARVRVALDAGPSRASAKGVWLISSILGIALGFALFFLPVRTVRQGDRSNAELLEALTESKENLEERVESRTAQLRERESQLQALSLRLVEVQEDERARISRDLHDELGQTLTGIRLRLTTVEARMGEDPQLQTQLNAAMQAVDVGVEQVRTLAHKMRPSALDKLGLGDSLMGLVTEWETLTSLSIDLEVGDEEPTGAAAEVLFRVAQEALTNVMRHAHAEHVHVSVGRLDGLWQLAVADDGVGLSADTGIGLGLLGLRERLERAGGTLQVVPGEQGGVRLEARLPWRSPMETEAR